MNNLIKYAYWLQINQYEYIMYSIQYIYQSKVEKCLNYFICVFSIIININSNYR